MFLIFNLILIFAICQVIVFGGTFALNMDYSFMWGLRLFVGIITLLAFHVLFTLIEINIKPFKEFKKDYKVNLKEDKHNG